MKHELKERTKRFSLSIIELVEKLPNKISCKIVSYQLIKSGTSVGANYRAALRARSDKEFIAKMNIVLEESDECCYWLEIILDQNWLKENNVKILLREANELTAIFVSTLKTMNNKVLGKKNSKI